MSLLPFQHDRLWNGPSMAGRDGPLLNLLNNLRPLKPTTGLKVTDLPDGILARLPHYLTCLDDWYATIQTCRRFYQTCGNTKATFPAFFTRPPRACGLPHHTDLLMAGSARQVADWAVTSQENRQELWDAIDAEGDEGLLKLGVEIARWSVGDVRALHEADVKVIEPLVKAIAANKLKGAGHRRDCRAARTYDGLQACDKDERACSVCEYRDLVRTNLFSFVIYCNLFHADIEESYSQLPLNVRLLGSELRRRWMKERMLVYEVYVHFKAIIS